MELYQAMFDYFLIGFTLALAYCLFIRFVLGGSTDVDLDGLIALSLVPLWPFLLIAAVTLLIAWPFVYLFTKILNTSED